LRPGTNGGGDNFRPVETGFFQENGVAGGAEHRMHALAAMIAAVACLPEIMARCHIGARREIFMMRGRCGLEMAHLRKRCRPAADHGAEKGKGEGGETHAGKIGTRRAK